MYVETLYSDMDYTFPVLLLLLLFVIYLLMILSVAEKRSVRIACLEA
jgi:hypothetical protein